MYVCWFGYVCNVCSRDDVDVDDDDGKCNQLNLLYSMLGFENPISDG